jgi:hypothetical protein
MTIADITLTAFTLCNSLRVVAYVPQIAKAAKDRSGAEAISLGTWGLFLVSHASAAAYALVNQNDWTMAWVFLGNAVGCGAILLITVWKRSEHRRRRSEGATPPFQLALRAILKWLRPFPGGARRRRLRAPGPTTSWPSREPSSLP